MAENRTVRKRIATKQSDEGDKNMKKLLAVAALLAIVLALSACCLKHEWVEATCTEPRTCAKCGKTEGEALGHTFAEATCTEPATCTVCGATEGEALGHTFVTEVTGTDMVAGVITGIERCTVCGATGEETQEAMTTFVDGNYFTFTPEEFVQRLQNAWDATNGDTLTLKFEYAVNSNGTKNFDILNQNDAWLGWGVFFDENGDQIPGDSDAKVCAVRLIAGPVTDMEDETLLYLLEITGSAMMQAVDSTIEDGESYWDAVANGDYSRNDGQAMNGLYYTVVRDADNGRYFLTVDVEAAWKALIAS